MKNKLLTFNLCHKWYLYILILTFNLLLLHPYLYSSGGRTGAEFLLIGVGARAQGLSGAYTAITDDVNSIYWNPGGLSKLKSTEMTFMHSSWLADTNYEFYAFAVPYKIGTFGLSIHYLNLGEFEGRKNQISQPYKFTAYDLSLSLGYGMKLTERNSLGINLKYIEENIETINSIGYGIDFGLQHSFNNNLNFGFTINNLGSKMKYVKEEVDLPLNITAGVAYRISTVNIGLDIKNYVYDNTTTVSFGTEFMPFNIISFRGGCLLPARHSIGNLTGGIGLKLGSNNQIDYAFTPFADLGSAHKLSLTIKF